MKLMTAHVEVSKLPELTSYALELQWRMENWQRAYAEAGLQQKLAWDLYVDAIDDGEDPKVIEERFIAGEMFDRICKETYAAWQKSKAIYLALWN